MAVPRAGCYGNDGNTAYSDDELSAASSSSIRLKRSRERRRKRVEARTPNATSTDHQEKCGSRNLLLQKQGSRGCLYPYSCDPEYPIHEEVHSINRRLYKKASERNIMLLQKLAESDNDVEEDTSRSPGVDRVKTF